MKHNKPSVLLVDDSSTNNLLLESALRGLDFNIVTAISGEQALKILQKQEIDLVLLDVMMPGMSGYDVLAKMKNEPKIAKVPVIMVTARSKIEEEKQAKALGAADYFEKPLDLELLVGKVKELVNELA